MRADRLLSILMLLQTKGRMTAHDLADQLEVSERTIYRDLEALGMAGIPVYTERGPGGGCSLIDGYQTKLTGLTEAEVRALFLINMAAPLADLGLGKALDDALLKLLAALPASSREKAEQARQRFHLDTTWWYHNNEIRSCFQTVQAAVWQDRRLCIVYREDDGAWSEVLVEPYGLVAKADVWYLVASCLGAWRVFRVSRIHIAEMLPEPFARLTDFDLASYWAAYCARSETNDPHYSVPLRLAPDEASQLPQTLSEWGYMLVESDEILEVNGASERIVPFRRAKEKKERPTAQWADYHKEKKLHVLNKAGEWIALHQQAKEKKGIQPAGEQEKKGFDLNKKNHIYRVTAQKKRPSLAQQKKVGSSKNIKKTAWGTNHQSHADGHIKKTPAGIHQKNETLSSSKKSRLSQTKKTGQSLLTTPHTGRQIKKTRLPLPKKPPLVQSIKKRIFTGLLRAA